VKARVLFRFHRAFDVCVQNLKILRALNPSIAIDGMYGGDGGIESVPAEAMSLLDTCWAIPLDDARYKWMHGDLCARWWFKERGRAQDFDHLYLIEWDLLFLKPLAEVFGPLQPGCNYGALFGTGAAARAGGWCWLSGACGDETAETLALLRQDGIGVDVDSLRVGVMGGCIFCRDFLERFAARPVPSHSNDEVRFSIYSAAFNVPLLDNGMLSDKRNRFNAENEEYGENDIDAVLAAGGAAVHPLRMVVPRLETKLAGEGRAA